MRRPAIIVSNCEALRPAWMSTTVALMGEVSDQSGGIGP